mgnify:CR=1 FL=1
MAVGGTPAQVRLRPEPGDPHLLARLVPALERMFPALKLAGVEQSKFRSAQPGEAAEIADRIRASGARLVLVGLGCPRQEVFAYEYRDDLPYD